MGGKIIPRKPGNSCPTVTYWSIPIDRSLVSNGHCANIPLNISNLKCKFDAFSDCVICQLDMKRD